MEVWVVTHPTKLSEPLYQRGLSLVDDDSVARIKRFFRREDSCRCLIGRLLPRVLLSERGVPAKSITFDKTDAGKPYFTTPDLNPRLAFNVSHDNELVAMVLGPLDSNTDVHGDGDSARAGRLGVDIMKCQLPLRVPFRSFVRTVGEALTPSESAFLLDPSKPTHEALKTFYQIWTLKEAYTKALGLGLGFDFARIECVSVDGTFTVDGKVPRGWEVSLFEVEVVGSGVYVGVAAQCTGGDGETVTRTVGSEGEGEGGCKVVEIEAGMFLRRAVRTLTGEECTV
ncbi:4'-phosphopantetheinyl transferase [Stereum hirsutum FP-91666 SS1]|uniref:4'-phosphopantetheinyl transferase n=1 Tax=Stereum hirsutum (strain FP-91666) TaxID=721885 RepID=UPI000440D68A|nr:4'-phosphopantetheinyl transferase [Stereum hirsutum FP-91666 SS1]EIM88252.1 4'-phosphopantetheinyl transferase [Stereum hirsutum FP-91666 SS1]